MSYEVEVSVVTEQFNGVFSFETLEQAAVKVRGNVATGLTLAGIVDRFKMYTKEDSYYFFWCDYENKAYCKISKVTD